MAAYLKFHRLEAAPFEGSESARLVLATEAFRNAFTEVKFGLEDGSPRICLSGSAGIGKSSLASALPKLLGDPCLCVLIRDPSMPWTRLKATLVRQLQLAGGLLSRSTLLQAREDGRRLVLILDQAEKISAESLEHLDVVLGYRSPEDEQLLQCVLLANLEPAAKGEEVPLLWWLDRLTTRQLRFGPIPEAGIRTYVDKHLKKAGWLGDGSLFTNSAIVAIHRYTGGVPGAVGALCEELLATAANRELPRVDAGLVEAVCDRDPDPSAKVRAEAAADECSDGYALASGSGAERRPSERPVMRPPPAPPPPEPRMEIQQGFVPMDEPDLAPRREIPFPTATTAPERGPRIREAAPELPPPSGRSARVRRNLMGVGLLMAALLAALYWPSDSDEPGNTMRTAPAPERAATSPEVDTISAKSLFGAAPQDRPRPDSESHAQHPNATHTGDASDASDVAIVFSLSELTDLPPAPKAETPAFEPWSSQQREPLAAGRTRARPSAPERPTIRTGQASAPDRRPARSTELESPAAPAASRPAAADSGSPAQD
jgi:general secretion pathway protein A